MMNKQDIDRVIMEAQGCAALGFFHEAWNKVESLPWEERVNPGTFAVRLMVSAGLQKWEMGKEVLRLIDASHPFFEREAAGRFHLAHAEFLCALGDVNLARECIRELSLVWPEGKGVALTSKKLESLWM